MGARVFSLIVEQFGLVFFVELLKLREMTAKIVLAVIVVILNYFFSKFFIFKERKAKNLDLAEGGK